MSVNCYDARELTPRLRLDDLELQHGGSASYGVHVRHLHSSACPCWIGRHPLRATLGRDELRDFGLSAILGLRLTEEDRRSDRWTACHEPPHHARPGSGLNHLWHRIIFRCGSGHLLGSGDIVRWPHTLLRGQRRTLLYRHGSSTPYKLTLSLDRKSGSDGCFSKSRKTLRITDGFTFVGPSAAAYRLQSCMIA